MDLILESLWRLPTPTGHAAFTTLISWHGTYYCAWRQAPGHGIIPPGHICIARLPQSLGRPSRRREEEVSPERLVFLQHAHGDVRDPRFFATSDTLYCLVGVYLPDPRHQHWQGLSIFPTDNVLVTHLTWTTDGETWASLTPMLRPNYWAWSAVYTSQLWYVAAYQGGMQTDVGSTLALFAGSSVSTAQYVGTIYDGLSFAADGAGPSVQHYPHMNPSEPVLWAPTLDTLACAVRTESGMDVGISVVPYTGWRWHGTALVFHPSAVLPWGNDGYALLAGRLLTRASVPMSQRQAAHKMSGVSSVWRTAVCVLFPGQHSPRHALTLPSWGDTGYAGLAYGPRPGTILMSYYTTPEGSTTPQGQIRIALVRVVADPVTGMDVLRAG